MELVQVTSADGLRLDGALRSAAAFAGHPTAIDAWLLLHGTGSNFYSSKLLAALEPRLAASAAVLRANTRGHDLVAPGGAPGRRWQGAAFERIDESPLDLAAWVALLAERGYRRIGLLGHSLGAIKALYWLATERPTSIVALAAVSPPRLSYSHYAASRRAEEFLETYRTAQAHVAAGRSDELMLVRFPLVYYVSAAAYLDRYGDHERYNALRLIERVELPLLVTYGTRELLADVAFEGMPDEIAKLPAGDLRKVAVVADADHAYTACEAALADRVELWLRRLENASA